MPEVSIIILNWKDKENTYNCVKSLYNSSYKDFEIMLIDNNSSDGSVEFFRKKLGKSAKVKIIESRENLGLAEGFNLGIRNSNADLICLLNNDVIVDKNWLSEIVSKAKSKHDIAIVTSRIKNLRGYDKKESCGNILNILFQAADIPKSDYETSMGNSAGMILRKEMFESNPYIPEYFGNYEDVYISILAKIKGYKIETSPKSRLIHIGSVSVSKVPDIMSFHMEKNNILNFFILYQAGTILKLLPIFILLHLINLSASIFTRRFRLKLKAYIWVIKHYKLILKYRKIVKRQRKISDKELIRTSLTYRLPIKGFTGRFFSELIRAYLFLVRIKTREHNKNNVSIFQ